MPQHVDERASYNPVDVQNKVRLLPGGDFLYLQSVLQQRSGREILHNELLHDLHPLIGIVHGLDAVPYSHDQLTFVAHLVDEFGRMETGVITELKKGRNQYQTKIVEEIKLLTFFNKSPTQILRSIFRLYIFNTLILSTVKL